MNRFVTLLLASVVQAIQDGAVMAPRRAGDGNALLQLPKSFTPTTTWKVRPARRSASKGDDGWSFVPCTRNGGQTVTRLVNSAFYALSQDTKCMLMEYLDFMERMYLAIPFNEQYRFFLVARNDAKNILRDYPDLMKYGWGYVRNFSDLMDRAY